MMPAGSPKERREAGPVDRGSTDSISARVVIAVMAPALAGTCLVLAVAGAEMFGATPLSVVSRNIAEAAAMANAADTLWFMQRGADPSRIEDVRPEIISSQITRLTALEAAVWSRQPELLALLDRRGAIGGDVRNALACLARDLEADEIVEYLERGSVPACEAGAATRAVEATVEGLGGVDAIVSNAASGVILAQL